MILLFLKFYSYSYGFSEYAPFLWWFLVSALKVQFFSFIVTFGGQPVGFRRPYWFLFFIKLTQNIFLDLHFTALPL